MQHESSYMRRRRERFPATGDQNGLSRPSTKAQQDSEVRKSPLASPTSRQPPALFAPIDGSTAGHCVSRRQDDARSSTASNGVASAKGRASPSPSSMQSQRVVDDLIRRDVTSWSPDDTLNQYTRWLVSSLVCSGSEILRRTKALQHVAEICAGLHCTVSLYGSLLTDTSLPSSDIDLVVLPMSSSMDEDASQRRSSGASSPGPRRHGGARGFSFPEYGLVLQQLRRHPRGTFSGVVPIAHARVPIIKCRYLPTGVDIDIAFQTDGIATSNYLNEQFTKPRFFRYAKDLIRLFKFLLQKWNLNDPKDGGVGGFVAALMVLYYLSLSPIAAADAATRIAVQMQDDIEDDDVTRRKSRSASRGTASSPKPEDTSRDQIGTLFAGFLNFWGSKFDFKHLVMHPRDEWTLSRKEASDYDLRIMNPLDPSRNAAAAATRFATDVVGRMATAARQLMTATQAGANGVHPGQRPWLQANFIAAFGPEAADLIARAQGASVEATSSAIHGGAPSAPNSSSRSPMTPQQRSQELLAAAERNSATLRLRERQNVGTSDEFPLATRRDRDTEEDRFQEYRAARRVMMSSNGSSGGGDGGNFSAPAAWGHRSEPRGAAADGDGTGWNVHRSLHAHQEVGAKRRRDVEA